MSQSVRADIFPAVVTVAPPTDPAPDSRRAPDPETQPGTRQLERARVVVTLDTVYIFKDSSQGPTLVFQERLDDYSPPSRQPREKGSIASRAMAVPQASLTTDSGKQISFHRSGACGCGSQLRSFDPFTQINQAASVNDH